MCLVLYHILSHCTLNYWCSWHTENDICWGFRWKILQKIETLYQCLKCIFHKMQEHLHDVDMLFSFFVFASYWCFFCNICIGNVVCAKLVRLKHIDSLSYVLELNYRGINLNFINLAKLLIDGDLESNSGPTQNSGKSLCGHPKKIKVLKEHQASLILVRAVMLNLLVVQRYKIFFNTI